MNREKYLENLEIKNRRLLLKIYDTYSKRIKEQIYQATLKGNDTTYLKKIRRGLGKEIKELQKYLKEYSIEATQLSLDLGVKVAIVGSVATKVAQSYAFGGVNKEAMQVLAKTTYEPLSKMAQQIGRATLNYLKRENFESSQTVLKALGKFIDSDYLRKVGIEGVGDVVVGSSTWQKVAKNIKEKIIDKGVLKVPYYNKKGNVIRYVNAKDYAKMVARTTTANVFREGSKQRILETFEDDGDLVVIINKSVFPDSPCIPYEGKILSLEGKTKGYTTIKEAMANGLFHPNCMHSFAVNDKIMEIYGY